MPLPYPLNILYTALIAAIARLDKSLSPSDTLARLRQTTWTFSHLIYVFHAILACFWLYIMSFPSFPLKLLIPILWITALIIPLTSQFFVPATPVLAWVMMFYTNQFIPYEYRPEISVSLLPTLETVLYGANVSDILTRYTHPVLDIIAWLPYGVLHFTLPFVVAIFLWLFRTKPVLPLWAKIFGYMNFIGVATQILMPCAAPWYELIYGLTPANYSIKGNAGGLGRIDALFGGHGYQNTFGTSPVVFGAFPSLHSGCATMEALFLSHFFPQTTKYVWAYTGILYWATMYLTHHYLIDVVGGACLSTFCFYLWLPDELKGSAATALPPNLVGAPGFGGTRKSKYDIYDIEEPRMGGRGGYEMEGSESQEASDEEVDITFRSPLPQVPGSAAFQQGKGPKGRGVGSVKKSHKHTASIASLIRAEERVEDG
ncbi:hypothetical protein JAAARDRAFT_176949 [Jaapia argillacea MUCL 33604]|uniref:Inositolphosphotransferase Aur1/Ipt1 domain-containing protein n=1 Tax=Jaapia argillacea MUCL 33604 TaxID=933084 RepID=A0A067PSR7_9AGAM|nr:hypothetical protein JAAARDRAFT_176949 [Jaapia argillacea MUCL 33604]